MVGDRFFRTQNSDFWEDTTGISQVIGVVLIVAITVTIAGIVAASLFAFGEQTENSTPTFTTETQFDDDTSGDGQTLTINHVSGDKIDTGELEIVIRDAKSDSSNEVEYVGNVLSSQLSGEWTSGTEITLDKTHFEDSSGTTLDSTGKYLDLTDATVLITWEDPEPGTDLTATLYECHVEFPNCEQSP